MATERKGRFKRIMAFALILTLCVTMMPIFSTANDAFAATTYKYKSSFISGGGDLTTKFSITVSGKKLTGLCTHGGAPSARSGKCTIKKLSRTNDRFYLAYYYGYVKGYTKGANGCDLARAFNYSAHKNAYHQSASKSKKMINNAKSYCKTKGVPNNFVAFVCNPTNNSHQEFVAWGYYSNGSCKLIKSSSNRNVSKTGAYTFANIQYKVYESKSTSSKVVGTLTCTAGGTTNTLKLAPDGNSTKTYYIKESKTNNYYNLNNSWYKVSISPGENAVLKVSDSPKVGSLTFTKTFTSDSDKGASTSGYNFVLTNTNNSSLKYTATSKDGVVSFSNVLIGTYKLTEQLTSAQMSQGVSSVTGPQTINIAAGTNKLNTTGNTFQNKKKTFHQLNSPIVKNSFVIQKTTTNSESLEGFTFLVENKAANYSKTFTTNESGYIRAEDVPAGTYTATEVMTKEQKAMYKQPASQTMTLDAGKSSTIVFTFENEAIKHPVKLKKTSSDNNIEGIEFTLTGTRYVGTDMETEIMPQRITTDENGEFDFGELAPGEYVIEETGFLSEYYQNNHKLNGYDNPAIAFTVTEDGVFIGDEKVSDGIISFKNIAHSVKLKKTEVLADGTKTNNPVADAEYSLYKVLTDAVTEEDTSVDVGEGTEEEIVEGVDGKKEEIFVGSYVTDENGEINIPVIAEGDYVLYETVVPAGYLAKTIEIKDKETDEITIKPQPIEFTVDSDMDVVVLEDTNQQSYGTIFVVKEDQDLQPVEDAEFTVYTDEACTNIAKDAYGTKLIKASDNKGFVIFADIPWGTYYLKETAIPRGYSAETKVYKAVIGYDSENDVINVDHEFHVTNNRTPGDIELTKIDEDENIIKESATYDLYDNNETLIKANLKTGADNNGDGVSDGEGKILITGLDWGSYYFLEKEAPAGYELSDKKVRFTINAMSGGTLQKINAVDKMINTQIIATKKILAKDIWFPNGTPTFIFKLKGTNAAGEEKTYHRTVTFSEEFVKHHTADDGYVSMSATFSDIDAGKYVLSEDVVSRYDFEFIEEASLVNGTINDDQTVTFDLMDTNEYGAATFVNEKYEWQDFSDSTLVSNLVKKKKVYTALLAEYTGSALEGNKVINDFDKHLTVTALYDDGTEEAISSEDYTVVDVDGNAFTRSPKVAGYYTLTVTHEEDGLTRADTVQVQVAATEKIAVRLNTNGGEPLDNLQVYKYDTIPESIKDSSKYTPSRKYYNFLGWYTDSTFTEAFDIKKTIITEEITLYAKWEKKPLNEYSWAEIKTISESGNAEDILIDSYTIVQADLAGNGTLSTANYEHTKAFNVNGKTYHAMIAGFNHDVKSDGSGKAGISFIVYEPVVSEKMNAGNSNAGGWGASYMRTTALASLYNNLPADMKAVISQVNKTSVYNDGGTAKTEVTKDFLWLPSQVELYGAWGYDAINVASAHFNNADFGQLLSIAGEGTQYALFKALVPDSILNSEAALARNESYWTRSVDFSNSTNFCTVTENGAASSK